MTSEHRSTLLAAYAIAELRSWLRQRGTPRRITRKGIESNEKLRRRRRVIERGVTRLFGCHRLTIRYEHHAHLLQETSEDQLTHALPRTKACPHYEKYRLRKCCGERKEAMRTVFNRSSR